jgi:hypothetical protein
MVYSSENLVTSSSFVVAKYFPKVPGKIAKINSNIIVLIPLTRFYVENNLRSSSASGSSTLFTSSEYSGLCVA